MYLNFSLGSVGEIGIEQRGEYMFCRSVNLNVLAYITPEGIVNINCKELHKRAVELESGTEDRLEQQIDGQQGHSVAVVIRE